MVSEQDLDLAISTVIDLISSNDTVMPAMEISAAALIPEIERAIPKADDTWVGELKKDVEHVADLTLGGWEYNRRSGELKYEGLKDNPKVSISAIDYPDMAKKERREG